MLRYVWIFAVLVKSKDSDSGVIGNRTRVKVVKNKVAPPFKVVEFDIMYGEGISKAGEVLDLATEMEIVKKSGSWFSFDGNRLGQGRDGVKDMLKDNPELLGILEQRIKDKIKGDETALLDKVEPNIVDDGEEE
jgi:recombination protein RecA